ncbi:aminodeoxychorismate synthase component I [Neisseria sp. Ec49-e6-T10]|uniref:aminodeoxychorismate synthase component I n=1 Tax=Neisseria sp. Ec49-e6-T10 TaxID=3140744 RepID=UPI003EBCC58E
MIELNFDFLAQSVRFEQPTKIIQTDDIQQVLTCLKEVEEWVEKGYFAAGFLSYEAAKAFDERYCCASSTNMPLLWFGLFDRALSQPEEVNLPKDYIQSLKFHWQAKTTKAQYEQAIERIHHEIEQGNTYQVNYTVRLKTNYQELDEQFLYQHLKKIQQARYAAYLNIGRYRIISASPELFFHLKDNVLTTKPMKGTAARGKTYTEDIKNKNELYNSTKNRAENIMIVDLLRNDVSHIAQVGTVKVPYLFDVEPYPNVWQMTSTVTATLKAHTGIVDVFKALFPCGSITGAPKVSTMNIINQLENEPRDIYCGAIGYITPQKEACFNVPIRTVMIDSEQKEATYGVGGGITWDSTSAAEYQELLDKADIILKEMIFPEHLLESILLDSGDYFLKELHLQRLYESSLYFGFVFSLQEINQQLEQIAKQYPKGHYKVRLLLSQIGHVQLDVQHIMENTQQLTATWADQPVNQHNVFLYHKTTERSHYPEVTLNEERLLFNEKNEVTEFVNGNVAILLNEQWLTPPVESGLLAGVMRAHLLAEGKLLERTIKRDEVKQAKQIVFFNSVRGWREVNMIAS